MQKVALFGAGGKMGLRLSRNLAGSAYEVPACRGLCGRAGTAEGRHWRDLCRCGPRHCGCRHCHSGRSGQCHRAHSLAIVPQLAPGTMVVCLDAAAPFAGHLPAQDDLTYFVTHPCHPPIFNAETDMLAKRDFFGGEHAQQAIVCAMMQGPEAHYAVGEALGKTIYAPVTRWHRVSVEQMALLEPGLSETVAASLQVMREAMDEVVRRGVPQEAARDFLLGHLNILGAVIFDEFEGVFSDACNKAIAFGKPALMRDDWKRVFEPAEIAASIQRIT